MGIVKSVRIDESLERELKRIQEELRKQLGDIDLSKPQASIIAAKILSEKNPIIKAELIKAKRGRRINSLIFL